MRVMAVPYISIRARNTSAVRCHLLYYPELANHDNYTSMTADSPISNDHGVTGINSKRSRLPITSVDAKSTNSNLNSSASRSFISRKASYMSAHATKVDTASEYETMLHLRERSGRCYGSKHLLQRPLGGLEIMYHHSLSKGTDMIYLMTEIETNFPVTPARARNALFLLSEKHPMLRMTIQCKEGTHSDGISFLEMDEVKLDFSSSERKDWLQFIMEEVAIPFDIVNGPLWRCRLLAQSDSCSDSSENYSPKKVVGKVDGRKQEEKSKLKHEKAATKNGFVYDSIFLFILHHSMMDGKYFLWLFNHFAEFLAKVEDQSTDRISVSEILPLLPPAEHVIVPTLSNITENKNPYSRSCSSIYVDLKHPSDKVLNDYNQRFSQDIKDSNSRQPRNLYMFHEFSELETYDIVRSCKEVGASANGACLAASVLAFVDLVYPSSVLEDFDIPFEFMLDLRRYCPSDLPRNIMKCFPGVFSTHVPMIAALKLTTRPVSYREFWNMSRSFGKTIQNEVKSPEKIFQCLRRTLNDSRTMKTANTKSGKSATVLCVSNLGCLDGVLTEDVKKKVRLAKLLGHSTVLIEDSPIFYVNNYLLNDRLVVNVGFCENYTSSSTTMEYIENFKKYVLMRPKL